MLALQYKRACIFCGHVGRPEISGVIATQVSYLGWVLFIISFFQPVLFVAVGGILCWMIFTKEVSCKNCEKKFLTYEEVRSSYTKDECGDSNSSSYNGDSDKGDAGENKDDSTQEKVKGEQNIRIFSCPSCKQKNRVRLPLPKGIGKCKVCSSKFSVYVDSEGHLYIESITSESKYDHSDSITSIYDCLALLEVTNDATKQEIKKAYKRKIMEYHPDKVNVLGRKLKALAEQETKKLNSAFAMLKNNGRV